ncbi:coiled-coil domain-containing protein 136 isoform X2 [Gouania willdenowi]|uniref:coiled-coil domain-containing protein 136 isoform X2 n=1 Tax=Gouania willdenowi TaxID=441366 RepID=UPI001055F47C|nr:coiled-coil domain-containing protein 136-like isoform X2 [Gouania willdenowi]
MDGLRLPPLIEEVLDSSDELKDLDPPFRTVKDRKDPLFVPEEEKAEVQLLQLLEELRESREESRRQQQSFMELQGLLEEERLTSAEQAENFSRQIHKLQGELRCVQEQLDTVQCEKDQELEEAQQEVLLLNQEVEEASCDVASLQEELCRLRAGQEVTSLRVELQQVLKTTAEYQQELSSLRAELSLKKTAEQGDETHLQEFTALTPDLSQLSTEEENLQPEQTDGLYLAVSGQTEPYISVSECEAELQEQEISTLKVKLRRAEEKIQRVEHMCDGLRRQLSDLQTLYDSSQQERAELQQELQRQIGPKTQTDTEGWNLAVAAVAVAAIAVLVVPSLTRT